MTDIFNDQFAFWAFLIPGFVLVWSFRYFTDSKKTGDFEFLGLGIICGFINLIVYQWLTKHGLAPIPDGAPIYVACFSLVPLAFGIGLFCAQISKWRWFQRVMKKLKYNWITGK